MFVSNLTPLLIVFSSVNSIDLSTKQQIIQNGIFIAAIASLIQLLPIWKIGTKLPLLCGIGFSFIGVSIMIITKYSYESLLGAIIVGGIFTFLMAFTTKYWMKFFPI
jgi:NCS2 family nucleobase:cation symporter-2